MMTLMNATTEPQETIVRIAFTRAQVKLLKAMFDHPEVLITLRFGATWAETNDIDWSAVLWTIKDEARYDEFLHEATRKSMFNMVERIGEKA
jgi:hypothetical protein